MSYYRLYPTRNNTIFRYGIYQKSTIASYDSTNINCGANPVMELMDGKGESKLLFGFQISNSLFNKLKLNSFTANLQLWDAGTLWEPPIPLSNIVLENFITNFTEGDGYSFLPPSASIGYSNWTNATSTTLWSSVTFNQVLSYDMNKVNEDFNFDISSSLANYISGSSVPGYLYNLSLKVNNRTDDPDNIYRKFIHSNYTKTVFRPYIEFFIDDVIKDDTNNFYAFQSNRIFFINKSGAAFSSTPSAFVTMDGTTSTIAPTQQSTNVWYIDLTPTIPSAPGKKAFCSIIWSINSIQVQKQILEVKSPNMLQDDYDISQLFFYPTTPLTHNTVKQGDILPYTVVSEIRGTGPIIVDSYEYKITSMDGFEMVPWTSTSIYRNSVYFNVNTEFFFPEQHYEVYIRNTTSNFTITSNLTHKFKVEMNDKSHLRNIDSSPYYPRENYFSK